MNFNLDTDNHLYALNTSKDYIDRINYKKYRIPVKGGYLTGVLLTPKQFPEKLPCVIGLHGFASKKEYLLSGKYSSIETLGIAEPLVLEGFSVFVHDQRGYGESPRMESSFQLNLADVGTVIQFCSELEFIDENKIGIIGYSLGGHLACAATKMFQNNLYASALISAPYDLSSVLKPLSLSPFIILPTIALLRRLLKEDQSSQITKAAAISIFEGLNLPLGATIKFNKLLGFIDSVTLTLEDNEFYLIVNKFKAPVNYLMVTAENINEYKPEDYVSEYKTIPSLFIQGNKDTTVSNDSLENLYRSASTPNKHKIVLPDTNHFFNYPVNKRKALYGELKQFFKKYLNKLEKSNVA